MLSIPPLGGASSHAPYRGDIKPPLEVVVLTLKEIIRSVRRQQEYEERVSSERYYNNHYEISYHDGETEKYEIRQDSVVIELA